MRSSTILAADDDPLLLMLLVHRLCADGHVVVTAPDGQAAWEAIQVRPPHLLIVDSMMPRMSGLELLRRIRADAALNAVQVIMLTAQRREDDVVTALRLGADDYLTKPFNPDELAARIARRTQSLAA